MFLNIQPRIPTAFSLLVHKSFQTLRSFQYRCCLNTHSTPYKILFKASRVIEQSSKSMVKNRRRLTIRAYKSCQVPFGSSCQSRGIIFPGIRARSLLVQIRMAKGVAPSMHSNLISRRRIIFLEPARCVMGAFNRTHLGRSIYRSVFKGLPASAVMTIGDEM